MFSQVERNNRREPKEKSCRSKETLTRIRRTSSDKTDERVRRVKEHSGHASGPSQPPGKSKEGGTEAERDHGGERSGWFERKLDGSNTLSAASRKLDGVDAASSMQIDVADVPMKIDVRVPIIRRSRRRASCHGSIAE